MISKYIDKFIRIVYDDLKVFLVFFLFMQIGNMYIDIRIAFVSTILFSSLSFFVNGLLRKEKQIKFLPFIGILSSIGITFILYAPYSTFDKAFISLYHIVIWLVSAINLKARVMAKRTMLYLFLPVIVLSYILLSIHFTGIDIKKLLGLIYPYLLLFYAVTFMLAVKMNLDQAYRSFSNKTINTINRQKNRFLFSYIPNLILLSIFVLVITNGYQASTSRTEMMETIEVESKDFEGESQVLEVVETNLKEQSIGKKLNKAEKDNKSGHFSFSFNIKSYVKPLFEISFMLMIVWFLFKWFHNTHKKTMDEEEDDLLEVRESLLTRENIGKYINRLKSSFIKEKDENLPEERALYKSYVLKLIKKGKVFRRGDTPKRYQGKSEDHILRDLTEVYQSYRYNGMKSSNETLKTIKECINKNDR